MKFRLQLISLAFLVHSWSALSFSIENWNPFTLRTGVIYRSPFRFLSGLLSPDTRADASPFDANDTNSSGVTSSSKPDSTVPPVPGSNLVNIPPQFRHLCYPNATNFATMASQFNSGMFCVFMETIYGCSDKPHRSNHYPVVTFLKEFDDRYLNVKIDSAALIRSETHFFTNYYITVFLEQERIRALPKFFHFEALKNIQPTSSFAFADGNDKNRWILVVDNKTDPVNGNISFYRNFIEEGHEVIGVIPQKEETDAALVYLRRKNYVEGFSIVGQLFYKFMFSTKGEYNEKSEFLRMLWGHNQEFIGCPKPVCLAPVVDTVFKMKDNITYVMIGKFFWDMATGFDIENAVFIDAVSVLEARFQLLGADIDASFYVPINDTIYFLKGIYIYSYANTSSTKPLKSVIHGIHIDEVLKGIPHHINAAFYYRPNSTVYFFREYHYWAYDMEHRKALSGYPRLVTDFEDMPPNIDAIYSDNYGTYYVFYGVFYAKFTEQEFKIGMKLKFQLSSVDFFGCDPKLYGDYIEYKKKMETEFGPLSAKQVLELTDNEGIVFTDDSNHENAIKKTAENQETGESFLTTFARLIVYGPFFTDISTEKKDTKGKITYYHTYIED